MKELSTEPDDLACVLQQTTLQNFAGVLNARRQIIRQQLKEIREQALATLEELDAYQNDLSSISELLGDAIDVTTAAFATAASSLSMTVHPPADLFTEAWLTKASHGFGVLLSVITRRYSIDLGLML